MSAKDDLDRYEQEWQRHQKWRKPPAHSVEKPGRYIADGRDLTVVLNEMPSDLRERVKGGLDGAIRALVDAAHAEVHAHKRSHALTEAQETIKELSQAEPTMAPLVDGLELS